MAKAKRPARGEPKTLANPENRSSKFLDRGSEDVETKPVYHRRASLAAKHMAASFGMILTPVIITLLLVVIVITIGCKGYDCSVTSITVAESLPYGAGGEEENGDKDPMTLALTTGGFILYLIVASFAFVGCVYFRLMKLMKILFVLVFTIMICLFSTIFFANMFFSLDIAFDWITFGFLVWNLFGTGLITFFHQGSLVVQQCYLIYISVLMANMLVQIVHASVTWLLLSVLVVWDLVAVLTPCGPLRLMANMIENRARAKDKEGGEFPNLIVYSTMVYLMADPANKRRSVRLYRPKLGLGDFIFYSLLVGKTTQICSLYITITSMVAVCTGLVLTLVGLIYLNHVLPALPISLTIALIIVFAQKYFTEPFQQVLNRNMILV